MEEIQNIFREVLDKENGFETHPFLIGDYNAKVGPKFKLPFEDSTLAFVLISIPSMFERSFLPFLLDKGTDADFIRDPLDECMKTLVKNAQNHLSPRFPSTFYHDFDLSPNRRPKVLVQTAGHVSGAVRLYRSPNLNPVCLHPKYGGWFALRGVFIFPSISCSSLRVKEPPSLLSSAQNIENLLLLYNNHWRDGRYRDVIPVEERYSRLQRLYFDTLPSERIPLIKKILVEGF